MSDHIPPTDGSFINSIVGEGTRFRGELELAGLLRIDGDFSGTITTDGKVLVGKNGRAECTIRAGTVVVGGIVRGNILSTEKVIILSTGMVIGNISTPRLVVEEGVVLNGNCAVSKEAMILRESPGKNLATPHPGGPQAENGGLFRMSEQAQEPGVAISVGASADELTSWNR